MWVKNASKEIFAWSAGGSAIFYVSNDRSGTVVIDESVLTDNTGDGFSTYPGIFFLGRKITFTNSTRSSLGRL